MAYDLLLRRQIGINVARRSTNDAPLSPVARALASAGLGVALICAALEPTIRRHADRRRYLKKFHDEFEGNTEIIPLQPWASSSVTPTSNPPSDDKPIADEVPIKFQDEFEGNTEMIPTRSMHELVYGRE